MGEKLKKTRPGAGSSVFFFKSKRGQQVSSLNRIADRSYPSPNDTMSYAEYREKLVRSVIGASPKKVTLLQKIIRFTIVFFNLQK